VRGRRIIDRFLRWRGTPFVALPLIGLVASRCDSSGTQAGAPRDAGPPGDSALVEGGVFVLRDAPEGSLTFVDEPTTPCSARGGTVREVFAAGGTTRLAFEALGRVGARRWAQGTEGSGYITLDLDGANPSTLIAPFYRANRAAPFGAGMLVFGSGPPGLLVTRVDAAGVESGLAFVGEDGSTGLAVGSTGDRALLLWGTSGGLRARGVRADGSFAGDAFLAHLAPGLEFAAAMAADKADDFAIAWMGASSAATQSLYFLKAGTTERVQRPSLLTRGAWRPVQMARLPSGFGLLIQAATGPAVVVLNEDGVPVGPARKLRGTSRGLGIAASGDRLGVVAWRNHTVPGENGAERRENDEVAFRPFDDKGAPAGPWVCLDGPVRDDGAMAAGIDGEANGFAVLYRTPTASVALARFDRDGTGDP
jgi:hypothetical protein